MDRKKELNDLFDNTVKTLNKRLKSGEATAAEMSVARNLLRDCGIDATPEAHPGLMDLAGLLPAAFNGPQDDGLQ